MNSTTVPPHESNADLASALEAVIERALRRALCDLGLAALGSEYIARRILPPGTTIRFLHDASKRGELAGTPSGRIWAYRRTDVERWLVERSARHSARPDRAVRPSWASRARALVSRGYQPAADVGSR